MSSPGAPTFGDSTATAGIEVRSPRPLGVVLRVSGAPATPPLLRLNHGTCLIGSAASCDLAITDKTVSRAHVVLELVPEGVSVRDLGSRNGTFYLGQRVESMVLGVGGRLRVGKSAVVMIEPDRESLDDSSLNTHEYRGLLGVSSAMRHVFGVLHRLEGSLVPVLVEGESGVGKEIVARAVHDGSRVASAPFVAVNCGAIPRDLVASELFGHRRGAFTGAHEHRRGAFEAAAGGTIFLDEIGELPLEVQPMLLRVLETGEVRSVGDDQARIIKVRLVAATNRDLQQRVAEGHFREDLYYRLAVVRVRIPPLRERPEDIDQLACHFAEREGLPAPPREILDLLRSRSLPGNARELRNVIQAYAAVGELPDAGAGRQDMRRAALRQAVDLERPFLEQRDELVDEFTRLYLGALLERTGDNQTAAAQLAGLDRTYLGRLLAKLGRAR